MTVLIVPALEPLGEEWPSLGDQVCAFMEEYLVFGPGDLRGQPYRIDAETRALIRRMYEVYPRKHPQSGRRRFKDCGLSMAKGTAKTEKAAAIVAVELHPDGPVRTVSWGVRGDPTMPVGGGVTDPYIPMIAYTEDQTEELAYGALKTMIEEGPLVHDFDIGLARIMRPGGDGKAEAIAAAPDAADGARTTHQHIDESHRFVLPRMKAAVQTMLRNIPKRFKADAWTLKTTTAYATGENSVAESDMDYARQIAAGKVKNSRMFYFHRSAAEDFDITKIDLGTTEGLELLRSAIIEARGPTSEWADIESIIAQFQDPTADIEYLCRVWLNLVRKGGGKAFDIEHWKTLKREGYTPKRGALIASGFDGARYFDSTALIATELHTGYQWPLGIWERPANATEWEVPEAEVDAVVEMMFERYEVARSYWDPPYWESSVAKWAGQFPDKVFKFPTNKYLRMGPAMRSYANSIAAGEVSHDGNAQFAAHIGNAVKKLTTVRDAEGNPFWVICKERPDSPFKIDAGVAGCISWEARNDAIAAGAKRSKQSVRITTIG